MIKYVCMYLTLRGKKVNYEIKGKGEPLLLAHGWGGSTKSLSELADLLSKKYRVISVDLPGFGHSDNPDPDWGVEEYSDFLVGIIDSLKIKPVVYFGHSFGGALGIYIAAKYPAYIKKLIVSGASYKRTRTSANVISKALKWLPRPLKILVYKIIYPQSDLYKVPALESNFRKIVLQDLSPLLNRIKQPSLILWGERDQQTPVNQARDINLKIKNSKLEIYNDIGHNLPLKYPELVVAEINKFT